MEIKAKISPAIAGEIIAVVKKAARIQSRYEDTGHHFFGARFCTSANSAGYASSGGNYIEVTENGDLEFSGPRAAFGGFQGAQLRFLSPTQAELWLGSMFETRSGIGSRWERSFDLDIIDVKVETATPWNPPWGDAPGFWDLSSKDKSTCLQLFADKNWETIVSQDRQVLSHEYLPGTRTQFFKLGSIEWALYEPQRVRAARVFQDRLKAIQATPEGRFSLHKAGLLSLPEWAITRQDIDPIWVDLKKRGYA